MKKTWFSFLEWSFLNIVEKAKDRAVPLKLLELETFLITLI